MTWSEASTLPLVACDCVELGPCSVCSSCEGVPLCALRETSPLGEGWCADVLRYESGRHPKPLPESLEVMGNCFSGSWLFGFDL